MKLEYLLLLVIKTSPNLIFKTQIEPNVIGVVFQTKSKCFFFYLLFGNVLDQEPRSSHGHVRRSRETSFSSSITQLRQVVLVSHDLNEER